MLNITGSRVVVDPTYRYKMPRLEARIEGRGNGIRTCLWNMDEVADALNRPSDIVTKFFGVELGAQSRWEAEAQKSTVNGAHTAADCQRLMNMFIDKFVLCPKCLLPETSLAVSLKKGVIFHKCSACGAKEQVDATHKLCTYIIKQAELASAAAVKSDKKEKKDKGGEKKEKKEKKVRELSTRR